MSGADRGAGGGGKLRFLTQLLSRGVVSYSCSCSSSYFFISV